MGKIREFAKPEIIIKMYSDMDKKRRLLHNQILEYVKDDEGFRIALAIEVEAIIKFEQAA